MNAPAVLRLDHVVKSYATPRGPVCVLRDTNLAIHPGEFIALTGPSGSGKSTLLNLAALLDQPTGGQIFFEEQAVSGLDEAAVSGIRKQKIGMVFQKFNLLPHRTALENVFFRFRYCDLDREEVERLSRAALANLGLSALAAQPARLLSGGEMQRVAIARAVALRPKLLLADEPTGNLDADSAHTVMDTFRALNREGISIVLATHNARLLEYCSRHLACRGGELVEMSR